MTVLPVTQPATQTKDDLKPVVKAFFDGPTFTVTYVVHCPITKACAVIDSVLDYDPVSGRTDTKAADPVISYIQENDLKPEWIMETHVHADHLSAAPYMKEKLGGKTAIGDFITTVQNTFGDIFNAEANFLRDGSQFDHRFHEGDEFELGHLKGHILHTPGHTPACVTIVIGDAAFVGDTLFMPDFGTARCDFPGGDARILYQSIEKILALPDSTRIFTGHDYKAPGRNVFAWESNVFEQRETNKHIAGKSEDEFVAMREKRDAELALPRLILPSVQVNMRAGQMPPKEENGTSYIKIPLNIF